MKDILVDTNILAEILIQFFSIKFKETGYFTISDVLDKNLTKLINNIVNAHTCSIGFQFVVISTCAIIEIARKFKEISEDKYNIYQFKQFINQPPEWFLIEELNENLCVNLYSIPSSVTLRNGKTKPVEWMDSLHLATALSREDCLFATTDGTLKNIHTFKNMIIKI